MGFLAKMKLAHQITMAHVNAGLTRDDSATKAQKIRENLTRLEGMEVEMTSQAFLDGNLNSVLALLRKNIAVGRDAAGAYERAAQVAQSVSDAVDAYTRNFDADAVERAKVASSLAYAQAQSVHAEAIDLLKRFQIEVMDYGKRAMSAA